MNEVEMKEDVPEFVTGRFDAARTRRAQWEGIWQDCYDYALPYRGDFSGRFGVGARRGETLYDATAPDAVDQLASLLLGYLTPPLTPWFAIKAGTDLSDEDAQKLTPVLDKATRVMQAHFDQSNFLVEAHQCFLDLVVAGTASLAFEEAPIGEASAFRFAALPLQDVYFEETAHGELGYVYRALDLTKAQILARYERADFSLTVFPDGESDQKRKFRIIEAVFPLDYVGGGYGFTVFFDETGSLIYKDRLSVSPFINFRWMKAPGEVYGRSPVMKALPDIKTANKVVELILKNASIAVTGIWQADDDGVINPATIELVPGAIIPKAVGSRGLTPLEMPARFDVSQLVLEDLRGRIRHALLADRLISASSRKSATATEIIERSGETALLLGATFGRLQVEFLGPLITRAYQILRRRGVVPDLPLDGRALAIEYRSPLARAQSEQHVKTMLGWIGAAGTLGAEAISKIDRGAVMEYLARSLGVPATFLIGVQPETQPEIQTNEGEK